MNRRLSQSDRPATTSPSSPASSSTSFGSSTSTDSKASIVTNKSSTKVRGESDRYRERASFQEDYNWEETLRNSTQWKEAIAVPTSSLKTHRREAGGQERARTSSDDLRAPWCFRPMFDPDEMEKSSNFARDGILSAPTAPPQEQAMPTPPNPPRKAPGESSYLSRLARAARQTFQHETGRSAQAEATKNFSSATKSSAVQSSQYTVSSVPAGDDDSAFQSPQYLVSSVPARVDDKGNIRVNTPKATLRTLKAREEFPEVPSGTTFGSTLFFEKVNSLSGFYPRDPPSPQKPSTKKCSLEVCAPESAVTGKIKFQAKRSPKELHEYLNSSACKTFIKQIEDSEKEESIVKSKTGSVIMHASARMRQGETARTRVQSLWRKPPEGETVPLSRYPLFLCKSVISSPSAENGTSHHLSIVSFSGASSSMLYDPDSAKESIEPEPEAPEMSLIDYQFDAYGKIMEPYKKPPLFEGDIMPKLMATVTVMIGDTHFKCDWNVLNSYTDFFMDCNLTGFNIKLSPEKIEPRIFAATYEWMLRNNTRIRRRALIELYLAASYLRIDDLITTCMSYFENGDVIREAAAFLLYKDATFYKVYDVQMNMLTRVQRFFYTLVASRDFCELNIESLVALLKSNAIGVNHEGEVLMAAVRWLNHDWDHRSIHAIEVIDCIRFILLPPRQLLDISMGNECPEVTRAIKKSNKDQGSHLNREIMKGITFNWALRQRDPEHYSRSVKEFEIMIPHKRLWIYDQRCPLHFRPGFFPSTPLKYHCFLEFLKYVRREGRNYWKRLKDLPEDVTIC